MISVMAADQHRLTLLDTLTEAHLSLLPLLADGMTDEELAKSSVGPPCRPPNSWSASFWHGSSAATGPKPRSSPGVMPALSLSAAPLLKHPTLRPPTF